MKRLILAALLCGAVSLGLAQTKTTTVTTTTTTYNGTDSIKNVVTKKTTVKIGMGDFRAHRDSVMHNKKASGFNFGLTFSRFDLGLTTLIDNGSFTLSPKKRFFKLPFLEIEQRGF